ncbi:MAG: PepSY domain-containing protein [Anaerovoracaceae bacterium]
MKSKKNNNYEIKELEKGKEAEMNYENEKDVNAIENANELEGLDLLSEESEAENNMGFFSKYKGYKIAGIAVAAVLLLGGIGFGASEILEDKGHKEGRNGGHKSEEEFERGEIGEKGDMKGKRGEDMAALAAEATVIQKDAEAIALKAEAGATVEKSHLESAAGKVVWEVELIRKDGTEVEVFVDAKTSQLINVVEKQDKNNGAKTMDKTKEETNNKVTQ